MKEVLFSCQIIMLLTCQLHAQNVGIGTALPGAKLHVLSGGSGYNGTYFPGAIIEGSGSTYLNIVTPDINESALIFGRTTDLAHGGIVYNNSSTLNGLQFRTNGNINRMVINQSGNVGIGTTLPGFPLNFASSLGDKIALWGNSGTHYGFGIQDNLLQVHTDLATADIAFGYGSSNAFTETMRIKGNGILQFPASLTKKITLYPGGTGDAGIGVFGNELRIASDNNGADITFGYDNRNLGFTEKFRMKATGAFALNGNEGQSGQQLTSKGSGQPAAWSNPLNALYDNMTEYSEIGTISPGPFTGVSIPGISNISLVIGSRSKVIFSSSLDIKSDACFGCGGSNAEVIVQFISGSLYQSAGNAVGNIASDETRTFVTANRLYTLNPGTYTINLILYNHNQSGPTVTGSYGRLDIIVIRE